LYRGISDFKKVYQPRTKVVKVKNSYSILARWRIHFSLLLNVHGVNVVRQTEMLTTEPLMSESSAFEVEMAIEKLVKK
jgi:hypothetical protein